jgi:type I restriction enzyme, S subunit
MSWNKVRIGSFLKERTGRYKPAEANKLGLRRIDKIDFSGTYHLVEKSTNTDMILVKKGDLLISGINAEKGAVTVYQDIEDALATIHYSSYELDKNIIDVEYFKWFLISEAFKKLLKAHTGSGIKTEIKSKHILPLEIYLPKLEQQKDLVKTIIVKYNRVSKLKSLIKEQENYLQQLRQTILQEAVQGKLIKQNKDDEPADKLLQRIKAEKHKLIAEGKLKKEKELLSITKCEIPFELPKGWVWCRFGELVLNVDYGTSEKSAISGDVPVLRMGNVQDREIVFSNLKYVRKSIKDLPKLFLKDRDIIFNRTNSYELVGKSGVYYGNEQEYTLASYLIRVTVPHDFISVKFVNYYINSNVCRETQIEPEITQQTGQANFSGSKLKSILFPLPPHSEQLRIVAKVQRVFEMVDQLEQQITKRQILVDHLLKAVLKEAFTGSGKFDSNNELMTLAVKAKIDY